MDSIDLTKLLGGLDQHVATEFRINPEVVEASGDLDVEKLPIQARRWHRVDDVVAVVGDLKSSTQLGTGRHAASTAAVYEAATGGMAQALAAFGANYIDIQGDGGFALFWGERRMERGLCAAITIKSFSEQCLVPRLEDKWPQAPETGFKVGVASSRLLAKRVGVPRTNHQDPVWAGKAVNYAAKACQQVDRHLLAVTGSIWDWASNNEYLAVSCPCQNGPSAAIWSNLTIDRLPENDSDREGKVLRSGWCTIHGPSYCTAILAGDSRRPDATQIRNFAQNAEMNSAIRKSAFQQREARRARNRGRNNWGRS